MKRRLVRLTGPKTFRWLAAGWDSPVHLCIVQAGVSVPMCGAKPKKLFVTRPSATRCQDCVKIEAARQAVRRAKIRLWFRSIPKRVAAWFRARLPRLAILRNGRLEVVR